MKRAFLILLCSLATVAAACNGGSSPPPATPDGASEPSGPSPSPTAAIVIQEPRRPTVVIDPGHGGPEVGAANAAYDIAEKHSNLDMALRVEALLQAEGVRVVLTRREDARAVDLGDSTAFGSTRRDLQARVDLANTEQADLFLSIHSNGSTDGSERGVEMWYDATREFADDNRLLAETLQRHVLAELAAHGTPAANRGIEDASCWRTRFDRCFSMFVIGGPRTTTRDELIQRGASPESLSLLEGRDSITTRATEMPGVLAELLFLSNDADAAILAHDAARWAIARGLAQGLLDMLPDQPQVSRGD